VRPVHARGDSGARVSDQPKAWQRAHREQLWQLIEASQRGVVAGDLISKSHRLDLERAGYAIRNAKGLNFSTPAGERALRDGHLS